MLVIERLHSCVATRLERLQHFAFVGHKPNPVLYLSEAFLDESEHLQAFEHGNLAEVTALHRNSFEQLKHVLLKVKAPDLDLVVVEGYELELFELEFLRDTNGIVGWRLQYSHLRAERQI